MNRIIKRIIFSVLVGLLISGGLALSINAKKCQETKAIVNEYIETDLFDGAEVAITTYSNTGVNYYLNNNASFTEYHELTSIPTSSIYKVMQSGSNWRFYRVVDYYQVGPTNDYLSRRTGLDYFSFQSNPVIEESTFSLTYYYPNTRYLKCIDKNKDLGVNDRNGYLYDGKDSKVAGTVFHYRFFSLKRTLTYNSNGGSGIMTDSVIDYAKNAIVTVADNEYTKANYIFAGWNTDPFGNGTSYSLGDSFSIVNDTTLYAMWAFDGTTYSVTDSLINGHLNNTQLVGEGETYEGTIIATDNYKTPASLIVTMGGSELTVGVDYTYNALTGEISIPNVQGNIDITGVCEEKHQYSITYTASEGGSGPDYVISDQWEGLYQLISANQLNTAGIVANQYYKFHHFEYNNQVYNPTEIIEFHSDITITAVFVELSDVMSITSDDLMDGSYDDNYGYHNSGNYKIYVQGAKRGENSTIQIRDDGRIWNYDPFSRGISMIRVEITAGANVVIAFSKTVQSASVDGMMAYGLETGMYYFIPQNSSEIYPYFYMIATDEVFIKSIEVYSNDTGAAEFSRIYLDGYVCAGDGLSEPILNEAKGYNNAYAYKYMFYYFNDDLKTMLQNAVVNHTSSYTTLLEEFGERYYLIVMNHGEDFDFMELLSNPIFQSNKVLKFADESNSTVFILLVVASLSFTGSLLFILKKKKILKNSEAADRNVKNSPF